MKILKGVAALFVVGFVMIMAPGCKKGNSYVDKLSDLEKNACACADKDCADREFKNFLAIVEDMKTTKARVSNDDGQKLGMSTANIVKCLMSKGISPVDIQKELQKFK
ncbi:MAG: hypothetical protein JXA07_14365 [Spirochaetes bacterium]|nr:hypothetical protein [Spirochaetota bacterium]